MNTIVEHINSAGFSFAEFALPMLVQSGVLIVILLLLDLLLRKKVKAVFRYWIWMLVLLKLILPTSLSSPLSLGYLFGDKLTYQDLAETTSALEFTDPVPTDNPPGISPIYIQPNVYTPPTMPIPSVVEPVMTGPVSPPAPVTPLSWQGVVFLVWLAVVIAMGLLLLQRALFVRGLVAQAKKASRLMNDELAYCCASMKIKCRVDLKISVNATTPSVCGLIRPVILVPWNLASTLGVSRLRTVLMHELAHIRRGDLWVNLAQTVFQIIFFYNPLLWLANCVIRRIREQAVDEAVLVAMGEGAQQYPQTLVDVAKMAFKRPALSLRLIGVVESKSALAERIKHILGRPMPKSAKLGLISILAIIIAGAVLLPMAMAQRLELAGRNGPLNIRLAGVRPDGSDDIYDGGGNKIAENTFADIVARWGEDEQHRTFIFQLPVTEEPILFSPFLKIKPTGAKHGFGSGQNSLLSYSDDKLIYSVSMNFPRTYKKVFERRVKKVDLTLRYYYGQRGPADFVFSGPFTPVQTVKAEGGADCELTATKDRLDFSHHPAAFFRISSKTRFNRNSVLVYDTSGRRYLPESGGGGSGSGGSGYRFRAEGLTLNSIACVTVGEKPYEATFKNVVVSYPDRPARDRMDFLDEMCQRLDLTGLSGEDLYDYKFENPADAIKVIDIVRGRWYVMQVFDAIRYSKPRVELSNLDTQTQQKVRSAVAGWAEVGHPNIRAMGIRLGLMGGWPEFMDRALEWLERDVVVYDMVSRTYRGLEEEAKGDVAREAARYPAGLNSEQAERIKKIILRTDNPRIGAQLFRLFWRADKEITYEVCRDLVKDDRPWIWWPAMYSLSNRSNEKLRPFENLPEKMQKRLILVKQASGSSRLFDVSSSGKDYETVAKEAYSMLPGIFTARLARMNVDVCRSVRTVMVKHLNREIATKAMTDFLREISTGPNQRLWAGDSYYFGTCCSTAYYIARHINSLYDVNIDNLGKYETPENSEAIPYNISQLKQLIAKTLRWYDVRSGAGNESGIAGEIGAGNKAGQSPFTATLPNGVKVELMGVCELPSEGKKWWRPDGSALEDGPSDHLRFRLDPGEDEQAREFAVHFGSPESENMKVRFDVRGGSNTSWHPFYQTEERRKLKPIQNVVCRLPRELSACDVRVGVSVGEWATVAYGGPEAVSSMVSTKESLTDGDVEFHTVYETGGLTVIKVSHQIGDRGECRVVVFDREDKLHEPEQVKNSGGSGINVSEGRFDLAANDIKSIGLQARACQWVEFKDVSLRPGMETDVKVAYSTTVTRRIRQAGKPDSGRDETYEFLTEPNRKTRLLTPKEWVEIDNWVSIVASVVKDNGRYLLPEDEELTLSELIRADGYETQRVPVSFLEIMRPVKLGQVRAYSIFSRNLETLFSKKESDPVLKRHDNIVGGYGNPAPNREEFLAPYSFGDVVELIINDDNSENNMFVDLDAGKLVTPDEDLDKKDLEKVLKWMSANGIDAVCNTSPEVGGLIGFGMVALSVDNYFWDADIPDFWDRLIMRIDSPVLISATHVLPATYLIKTSEYKMGILQILGFTDKPEGVRIRYKLVDKGETERPDVHVGFEKAEPVFVEAIEAGKEGISRPIRKIFSGETDKGGSFKWETSIDPRVRFRHGWYSLVDGMVKEHVGAGASRNPDEGKLNLKLDVEVKDNMLNLKVQRVHDLDDGSRTAAVASKTTVPAGAYLKHVSSIDSAVLTNQHLTLWRGDFIRDDKVVKSVIYAAYLTTPDDQETGFKPPGLQKGEIVTAKVRPDAGPVIESNVSPKLVMLLGAINSCAAETELNIESISITARNISIKGDTSGRTNTLKFLDAIKKNELEVLQLSFVARDNRNKFSLVVKPKENWQKWWQRHKTDVHVGVEETISPKLVMLLGAINSCAAETELNIESISITAAKIEIKGDTAGRTNTLKFLDAVKKNELEVLRLSDIARDNRNKFSMVVEPKKNWRQWWQKHKTAVPVGIKSDSTVQAVPLKAFEFKLFEKLLSLVKQVEKEYPEQATHWPAGAGLYHIDAQGRVTVWHYRSLWQRSNDCAPDEVGWGSSQLVNAVGMYYLPGGTPLQSRWRERGGGMKDIRIQVGREVGENERVPIIHRHRLPGGHDLLSRDGLERKIMLDSWKDLPLAIIVRVDRPMRLAGWWLGDVKTDIQHFNEYDQLIVKGPPGNNNKPMLVTVGLSETDVQVESEPVDTDNPRAAISAIVEQLKSAKYVHSGRGSAHVVEVHSSSSYQSSTRIEKILDFRFEGDLSRSDAFTFEKGKRGDFECSWTVGPMSSVRYNADEKATVQARPFSRFHRRWGYDFHPQTFPRIFQRSIVEVLEAMARQPQLTLKVTQESKDVIRIVSEYKKETSEQKLGMLLINGADGMRLSSWEFTAKDSTEDGTGARRSRLQLKWRKYAGVWYISEAISEGAGVHDGLRSEGKTTVTIREFTPNVEIEDKEFALDGLDIRPGVMVNDRILDTRYRYAGSKGESADKLRKLSRAAQMYANDYDNKFPDTMQQLKRFLDEEELKWLSENVCYLGKGKTVLDNPEIPLAYDKTMFEAEQSKGTNVLFVSGIVSYREREQLKKLGITAGPKTDVPVGTEKPVAGGWEDIGNAIPADYNDTIPLTEQIDLGSIGRDVEGKSFITFVWDKEKDRSRQYRFVLVNKSDAVLEPVGHLILDENGRLVEKFTFDEPHVSWRSVEFKFQSRPLPLAGNRSISSQLQKGTSTAFEGKTISSSKLAPPGRYAIELDGVDDYLLVPDSPTLRLEPPFTVEMWIKPRLPEQMPDHVQQWGVIAQGGYVGTGRAKPRGFGIELTRFEKEPETFNVSYHEANDSGLFGQDYGRYHFDEWMHISHVFEGENYNPSRGHPLVVGRFLIPSAEPFMGQIGEVRIWKGARKREEIRRYRDVALTGKEPGLAACWTFEQNEGQFAYDMSGNTNHARLGKAVEPDGADPKWIDLEAATHQPGRIADVPIEAEREKDTLVKRRTKFLGLDLTDAPRATKSANLSDLFEARPPGSKSYHRREDVDVVYTGLYGTVYYIPEKDIFYIQYDKLGASTLHYYGPFNGDPRQVLRMEKGMPIEGGWGVLRLFTALQDDKYVGIRDGITRFVEEKEDKELVSFLVEQLKSENRMRRCHAALCLELLGDRRGVPAIIKELSDTSYRPTTMIDSGGGEYQEGQVRQDHYYAAVLLGILGDERAVPALIEAIKDDSIDWLVAQSLGQIGDKRAVPVLRAMLDKNMNKPFQRLYAGYGLAMLSDEEGLEVVIETLNNRQVQWSDRRYAIVLLGKLGDKQGVPHLIVALKDDHPNIKVSAARALGTIGDASALPALEEALKDDTETKVNAPTTVSKAAAEAIAQIKAGNGRIADVPVKAEETGAISGENEVTASEDGPRIKFESLVCDLGRIPPNTKHFCEFKYTNTGNALLKITRVGAACACTVPQKTRECAPGESETLKVTYRASGRAGRITKPVYVYSNDKVNPKVQLTIKAEIVIKVAHEPENLKILLKGENAGCPPITLTSLDKQPFSITGFKATGDSITADFDSSVKETSLVIQPKADMEKIRKGLKGQIEIGLTHPECKKLIMIYDALPEFKFDPRVVYVREAEPLKSVTKKVWIRSNYNEDVEIESTSSKKGTVKVLTQEKVRNRHLFELEITPPAQESKRRVFTDVFTVSLKGGQKLQMTCYGIYSKKLVETVEESVPKTEVQVEGEQGDEDSEAANSELTVPRPVETRGRISGVVINSATGKPIAGAYVGVGDFGDSGGSNYSRHREQGFHDKTKTDEQGRFELDGLAFTDDHPYLKVHPLVVTHPDFVRHDGKIELLKDKPEPDVKVSLRPAAKIDVTIVDTQGNPLQGQWLIRLQALDGRRFIPPGSDPHLSSFASSIWAHMPDLRTKMGASNGFTFTELDAGEYSIEALRFHLVDNPTPENIWKPTITYHGSIPSLKIQAGQAKEVKLAPQDYQTSVSINMPEDPIKKPQIPPFVLISRNTGLLLWNDGKAHGPEDHRLGRLQKNALYYNLVVDADVFTIQNLPPGSYSVFAGPVYFMSAIRMEVSRGREVVVDMPPIQITEHAKVGLWTFDRKVKLQARDYSVSELCELLTAVTESNPRIIADSLIENEKLRFGRGEMSVWDVLEKLYLDKGWRVDEGENKTLVLKPGTKTDMQGELEKADKNLYTSKTWQEAFYEAERIIRTRQTWPETPEALAKAFWKTRALKYYKEMEILWPGSGSWNWAEICKNDPAVNYVFGKARKDNPNVPYASEEYFAENQSYNLTMCISSLSTKKGKRYYITSGN